MLESIFTSVVGWTGMVGSVILMVVGYLGRKYLIPYLLVAKRREYAIWIAAIADELTDDLKARYPNNGWVNNLDAAIDKLMDICDISKVIAKRAVNAAVARKK